MEKNTIDVSIVVPVYNAEKYLSKCIDSVLSQTLQSIEIILVNDGSTDNSGNICNDYVAKDKRVHVLHIENGGPARARNQGMALAKGKYIGFVDADDHIDSCMYAQLFQRAEETESDIVICNYAIVSGAEMRLIDMDCDLLYYGNAAIKSGLIQRYYTGNVNGMYSMCNKLFKRLLITKNKLMIDESLMRGEDAWFVFVCLKVSDKVSYIPDVLYYYYQNPTSIMHTVSKEQFAKWSYTRSRLIEENKQMQFSVNFDDFYRDYLYKSVGFCREMVQCNEIDIVRSVFREPVFVQALPYRSKLPIHVTLLLWVIEKRWYSVAVLIFRIWSIMQ